MITSLSSWITNALIRFGFVEKEEKELYDYGLFILTSHVIFGLVTTVFGLLMNVIWESILFYSLFLLLRGYAGGVHASRESTCMVWTTAALFISVALIAAFKEYNLVIASGVTASLGMKVVIWLSPMDTKEKRLDQEERSHYRLVTIVISLAMYVVAIGFTLAGWATLLYIVSMVFALESVLLISGKVQHS